jgi:DNA (cytosine-5)-methyltransferase 1
MGGDRSSLILEAIRLVRECRPRVFIWENVKGAFSSNSGEDFAAIIQEFADIGGYRLEWQLLNTSWFLPQNRERIYLVGYSTTPKRGWRGVFPIRESGEQTNLRGINVIATSENDVQSRRVYGSDGIARTLTSGDYKSPMRVEVKQIGTRLDSNGGTQPYQQDRVYDADGIVPALNQGKSDLIIKAGTWRTYKDGQGFRAIRNGNAPTIPASARENGSGQPVIKMNYASKALTEPHHNSLRMFDDYRIRRLTPIECERLQGFPDDHTAFGNYDGEVKPVSNSQRYKQCGNAVTVDVVLAVAKKCIPLFK